MTEMKNWMKIILYCVTNIQVHCQSISQCQYLLQK